MVVHVRTVAFAGIEAVPVDVQVQLASGLPAFTVVGLPDKAIAESRERVRAALTAIGLALPPKRITVNLAPADLPKEGSHYDLPIILALMGALGIVPGDSLARYAVLGELGLDASIAPVTGTLPAAVAANAQGLGLICPEDCGPEAAWAGDALDILAPRNVVQIVNHFKGTQIMSRPRALAADEAAGLADFADIKGQEAARRALEIAAAGGHNLLMIGPPGAGKSMLSERLPSILPPMDAREMLEASMIASVAGTLREGRIGRRRPFRAPHHSASQAAMVGGGQRAKPGEMALAHNGVLFLDELPEFPPKVLESLRQPMETGETVIARANHHVAYPARFQLIAAMNACKCGRAGEPGHTCKRGARCADDYQARLSAPLLDRIDLRIEVPAVRAADMIAPSSNEASAAIRARVEAARERQRQRFAELGASAVRINARADGEVLAAIVQPDGPGVALLGEAADRMNLSARGYHRVLRVARTLADLEGRDQVTRIDIAEALSYRGAGNGLLQAA